MNMSFDQVRGVICVFEVFAIYKFLRDFSLGPSAVLAAFIIFPSFLAAELFRWLLGMSIILFGLKYIIFANTKLDYLKYFACVVVAALSHSSCWFFLVYYLILVKNRRIIIYSVVSAVLVGFVFRNVGWFFDFFSQFFIREGLIEKYQTGHYANTTGILLSVIKTLVIVFMSIYAHEGLKKKKNILMIKESGIIHPKEQVAVDFNERIVDISIISLLAIIPMYFSIVSARLIQVPLLLIYVSLVNKGVLERNNKYIWLPISLSSAYLISALFLEGSSGPLIAFSSHFKEGFLIRFFETIINLL